MDETPITHLSATSRWPVARVPLGVISFFIVVAVARYGGYDDADGLRKFLSSVVIDFATQLLFCA